MKYTPSKLIYHTLHSRPMHGYFPLFFILSAIGVIGGMRLFDVRVSVPLRPQGVGAVLYKNDELTQFRVRQNSALPLHLPRSVDPAEQISIPGNTLPTRRKVPLLPAPPEDFLSGSCRTILLDDSVPMPDLEKIPMENVPSVAPNNGPR